MFYGYDGSLVSASYCAAVMAAYTALYFGARLHSAHDHNYQSWLTVGALLLGSGVWTMHFVGMRAMPGSEELSFDALLTAISWLAAIVASGIALTLIGRDRIKIGQFAMATAAMAGGIVVMHYLGMYAMQMSVAPELHIGFLLLSVGIALGASGAALAICRTLIGRRGARAVLLQLAAALVMGGAICGMHYVGMLALNFPAEAVPAADNQLRGEWMGVPLAIACVALLSVALMVAAWDLRALREQALSEAEEARWVEEKAFLDATTGLLNRSGFELKLLELLAKPQARQHPFALIYLDVANVRELMARDGDGAREKSMWALSQSLPSLLAEGTTLARYSNSAFMVLVPDYDEASRRFMYKRLRHLDKQLEIDEGPITWRVGQSLYPTSGISSRTLIRAAMQPREMAKLGHFADMKTDPDLVLPGQLSG